MTSRITQAIARWLTLLTPWRTIRQLKREVARLEAIIANPCLAGLEIGRETGIEVGLRGSGPQLLAGMFAGLLETHGANAPNYLEVEFHTHSQGRILVRVQRLHGETPHALRVKAERQAAAWKALRAELVTAVDEAFDAVDRTSDCVNAANHPELWVQCVDLIRRQDDLIARARAALARWGAPAIQPVPVSERLPGADACDAEGRCWIFMPDIGTNPSWRLADPRVIGPCHTHWLPANALPLPQGHDN